MSDDEDAPALSAETFAALQQFYTEQDARDQGRVGEGAFGGVNGLFDMLSRFYLSTVYIAHSEQGIRIHHFE